MIYIHILGGSIVLISGAFALSAPKGERFHRAGGLVFVMAMLLLAASALPLAVADQSRTSVMGALLVSYLVLTSLATVRRFETRFKWVLGASLLSAIAIGSMFLALAVEGFTSSTGTIDGLPPQPMLVFATVAFLAGLGDLRLILAWKVNRAWRIGRHLWRMSFALLMATVSFFIGQAQLFPEVVRNPALLAVLPLLVLGFMLYWMVRVHWKGPPSRRRLLSPRMQGE